MFLFIKVHLLCSAFVLLLSAYYSLVILSSTPHISRTTSKSLLGAMSLHFPVLVVYLFR